MTINPDFLLHYRQLIQAAATIPDYQTRTSKLKALNDYFQKATGTGGNQVQLPPGYTQIPSGMRDTAKGQVETYKTLSPGQISVQDAIQAAKLVKAKQDQMDALKAQGDNLMGTFLRPVVTPGPDGQFQETTEVPKGVDPATGVATFATTTKSGTHQGQDRITYRPMTLADLSQGSNPFNSYSADTSVNNPISASRDLPQNPPPRPVMYFPGGGQVPIDPLTYAHAVSIAQQLQGRPAIDTTHMYDPMQAQGNPNYPFQGAPSLADFRVMNQSPAALAAGTPDLAPPSSDLDPRFRSNTPATPRPIDSIPAPVQSADLQGPPSPKSLDHVTALKFFQDASGDVQKARQAALDAGYLVQ